MPDPSPSNADSLKLQLLTARKKEWWPTTADTVYPERLPLSCDTHYVIAGIEPTTFRLLVRRATSKATEKYTFFFCTDYWNLRCRFRGHYFCPCPQESTSCYVMLWDVTNTHATLLDWTWSTVSHIDRLLTSRSCSWCRVCLSAE